MKPNLLTHAMGALLICVGVSACGEQGTARQEAQAPYTDTTTPAQQQPMDTTAQTGSDTMTDPYATTETDPYTTPPQTDQIDAMTGSDTMTDSTDISGAQTTGDTLGDRCAGLSGPALTDCLETEQLRQQDVQDPTLIQDEDMPEQ